MKDTFLSSENNWYQEETPLLKSVKKMTSLLILILDYEKINKKIFLYLAIWSKFQLSKNYY